MCEFRAEAVMVVCHACQASVCLEVRASTDAEASAWAEMHRDPCLHMYRGTVQHEGSMTSPCKHVMANGDTAIFHVPMEESTLLRMCSR